MNRIAIPLAALVLVVTAILLAPLNQHRFASPEAVASAVPPPSQALPITPPSPTSDAQHAALEVERRAWQLWDAARKEGVLKVDLDRPFRVEFVDVYEYPIEPIGDDVVIDFGNDRYLYYVLYLDTLKTAA